MPEKELDKNRLFEEFIHKPVNKDNIGYFSYFFYQIERTEFGTELINTKRSLIEPKLIKILNELSQIDDDDYKIDLYISLINSIKMLHLLEQKYVISAFEGNQVFNEKVALIKERFPKYVNELDEILKEKEN